MRVGMRASRLGSANYAELAFEYQRKRDMKQFWEAMCRGWNMLTPPQQLAALRLKKMAPPADKNLMFNGREAGAYMREM